jgi:hypothetical protein
VKAISVNSQNQYVNKISGLEFCAIGEVKKCRCKGGISG